MSDNSENQDLKNLEDKLNRKIFLRGKVVVESGLHVGGADNSLDIGGERNPVIRIHRNGFDEPYIPGSSIKGKIRSMLEHLRGDFGHRGKELVEADKESQPTARIFGTGAGGDGNGQSSFSRSSRVIFRDAFISDADNTDPTEVKTENSVSRITSKANPRPIERVLPDTEFNLEIVFDVYEKDLEKKDAYADKKQDDDFVNDAQRIIGYTLIGMTLVEESYLGGGGSRGSGKVKFVLDGFEVKTKQDYLTFGKKTAVSCNEIPVSMPSFQELAIKLGV